MGKVFGVNVFGTARVTRHLHPLLVAGQNPVIVNTCSFASTTGIPKQAVYSVSKGALESLTKACAADAPWVQRLLAQTSDPGGERARLEARQPVGRLVTADEAAHAIVYLADPLSGSTTGTVIAVDGRITGLRLPR